MLICNPGAPLRPGTYLTEALGGMTMSATSVSVSVFEADSEAGRLCLDFRHTVVQPIVLLLSKNRTPGKPSLLS